MTIQLSTGPSLITTTGIRKFKGTSTKHPNKMKFASFPIPLSAQEVFPAMS